MAGMHGRHAWQAYKEVTHIIYIFGYSHPFQCLDIDSEHFKNIERYVVVLYDKTSSLSFVNEAREGLFCHKSRSIDNIPPTQDTLLQHTRFAV